MFELKDPRWKHDIHLFCVLSFEQNKCFLSWMWGYQNLASLQRRHLLVDRRTDGSNGYRFQFLLHSEKSQEKKKTYALFTLTCAHRSNT